MAVIVPQVITESKASGAQIIDGSLKFDVNKTQYLNRTFGAGNRKTWTFSSWVKKSSFGASKRGLFGYDSTNDHIRLQNNDDGGDSIRIVAPSVFDYILSRKDRDTGWFHLVVACDTTDGTAGDRVKIYHNGVRQTSFYSSSNPGPSADTGFNQAAAHSLGRGGTGGDTAYVDASLSNVYWIDGQALGPESFGFTDPLTNTWRPKKLEGVDLNGTTFTSKVIIHWTHTGGAVSAGVYNAAIGSVSTGGSYSGDTWTATNSAWVDTWDMGSADSFTLSSWSVGSYSNQTWYWSNDSSFASGVTGPNSGTIANGTYSTTVSGTKYRYLRVQNIPSATYSVVGNNSHTGKLGTNGFYLPMDGNSPIGEDQSGNGNNWTPVNFGGSVALDNPIVSGALPILNTDGGGNIARVGVRTDAYHANLVLALPLVGSKDDVSNQINSGSTTKTTAVTGNAASNSSASNFYGSSFYFDGTNDYIDNTITALGTRDFTLEFWCYTAVTQGYQTLLEYGDHSSNGFLMTYRDGTGMFVRNTGAVDISNATYASPSKDMPKDKWHHITLTRESNTAKLFINGKYIGNATFSTNYTATNIRLGHAIYSAGGPSEDLNGYIQDVRLYDGAVKYTGTTINEQSFIVPATSPDVLPDTPSGVSGSSKLTKVTDGAVAFGSSGYMTTTSSDYNPGTGDFAIEGYFIFSDNSGTRRAFINDTGGFGSNSMVIRQYNTGFEFYCGGQSFSDSGYNMAQWNHAMITRSGSTIRYFVNGELRATDTSSNSISAEPANQLTIGGFYDSGGGGEYMNGHASNLRLTVGSIPTDYQTSSTSAGTQIFTPSSAPLTSTSQGATSSDVKLLCCQSPTSATTAAVSSGSLSTNNTVEGSTFNPFNTDINTVRGQETGYCTMNPLDTTLGSNLQDGNLKTVGNSSWSTSHARGTFKMTSGKWFWEGTKSGGGGAVGQFGFANSSANLSESYSSAPDNSWTFYFGNGTEIIVPAANSGSYFAGSAMTNGDTAGVALDMDNGTWQFFKNGVGGVVKTLADTDSGSTASITELYPYVGSYNSNFDLNFGQKPFKFPPPEGFQPLNAANVKPETVIARPDQFVGVKTFTIPDNGSGGSVTLDNDFDMVWTKNRTNGSTNHVLQDSVRGYGDNKNLHPNLTVAQTSTNNITAVNGRILTIGSNTNYYDNNVAWSWRAGGSKNTFNVDDVGYASAAAAGLTGGTITPTGSSVGTRQGFSIIGFTDGGSACSIPHGLTKAPDFYIVKFSGASGNWSIYHKSLGNTKRLKFTTDNSGSADAGWWQNTSPTSSLFYLGGNLVTSTTQIAYLWHDVPGLQKFGSYLGNGSDDGTFVETGFRPTLLWIKNTTTNGELWCAHDSKRDPFNPAKERLELNGSGAEDDSQNARIKDFLSNGFKIRGQSGEHNTDGDVYIYAAWAEAPAFNLYGGQSNAR